MESRDTDSHSSFQPCRFYSLVGCSLGYTVWIAQSSEETRMTVYQSTYSFVSSKSVLYPSLKVHCFSYPLPGDSQVTMVYLPTNRSMIQISPTIRWFAQIFSLVIFAAPLMRVQRRILAVEVGLGLEMERVGGFRIAVLAQWISTHIWLINICSSNLYECCNNFSDIKTLKHVPFFCVCFSMRDAVYFTNMHHFQNWLRDIVEWGGTKHGSQKRTVETFEKVAAFSWIYQEKLGTNDPGSMVLNCPFLSGRSSICTRAP